MFRFSNLLSMLAFVDITYLTLKFIFTMSKILDSAFPGRNMGNFWYKFHPFFFHPLLKITQMAMIIITVILSVDRFIVIFYPYRIYRQALTVTAVTLILLLILLTYIHSVNGCLRTLLRGPKKIHVAPYLGTLLCNVLNMNCL